MKTAREIISRATAEHWDLGPNDAEIFELQADAILDALSAEGYRILAPGELCPETLERAAKIAEGGYQDDGTFIYTVEGPAIANALRSLDTKGEGE